MGVYPLVVDFDVENFFASKLDHSTNFFAG